MKNYTPNLYVCEYHFESLAHIKKRWEITMSDMLNFPPAIQNASVFN